MKEKTITIKTNGIAQRQYSTLLLELNIMKQQWKSYGVHLTISAPGLKKIISIWVQVMDLIILNDGMYSLLSVTKEMIDGIVLTKDIDCFDLCEILRIKLINLH